ncbi:MAG: ribose 5-phosphate isomerase B [Deltaproteobacteria bacterium]|nr:ribose 5-phosphate isomerase B [Deltaproteobacteria bacterium]MBF0525272.1 ribose 5-phosphate isomerase B [Deltaproteobacteria bacterium]
MTANARKILIGSDHGGYTLKESLKKFISACRHEVIDVGTDSESSVDYPNYAMEVAKRVAADKTLTGILICGTGQGMCMVANRVRGVRAALCNELFTARMARAHNNANILTMGGRVVGPGLAEEIVSLFLNTPFEGGRHQRRIDLFEQG